MNPFDEPYAAVATPRLHAAAAGVRTIGRAAAMAWESLAIDPSVAESIATARLRPAGAGETELRVIHGDVDAVSV